MPPPDPTQPPLPRSIKRGGAKAPGIAKLREFLVQMCMMAAALVRSKNIALRAFYRRMAVRRGGLLANKALASKLAAWFWRVMVKGDNYVEKGIADYEEQVRKGKERALQRLAKVPVKQLVRAGQPPANPVAWR